MIKDVQKVRLKTNKGQMTEGSLPHEIIRGDVKKSPELGTLSQLEGEGGQRKVLSQFTKLVGFEAKIGVM